MTAELDKPKDAELATLSEAEETALAQSALADLGDAELTLPMLKLVQALSKDHTERDVELGHYVNSLTGKDYGDKAELVVCYTFKGRFFSDRNTGRSYSAASPNAPDFWPEKYAGKPFVEIPDAEETYRERVNAGEIEWESGPKVRTTFNYVGFIAEDPEIPVRLSLMRTSKKASDKLQAIIRWSLKAPWHAAINLGSNRQTDSQDNPFYVVTVDQGRETTDEERQAAVQLHQNILANKDRLNLHGDSDESAEQSAAKRANAKPEGDALSVA